MLAFSQALLHNKLDALREIVGENQARQLFALRLALDDVIRKGVTIEDIVERDFGEKGSSKETRVKLNPAVEAIGVINRALGGTSLNDWLLTPKSGTDESLKQDLQSLTNRLLSGFNPSPALPEPSDPEEDPE